MYHVSYPANACIAKENPSGSIRAIAWCGDDFLENKGYLLLDHYDDPAKADALIALGDIYHLGKQVESDDFIKKFGFYAENPAFKQLPYYVQNQYITNSDATIAFRRDRGDSKAIQRFNSRTEFCQSQFRQLISTAYLMLPDQQGVYRWYVSNDFDGSWHRLAKKTHLYALEQTCLL